MQHELIDRISEFAKQEAERVGLNVEVLSRTDAAGNPSVNIAAVDVDKAEADFRRFASVYGYDPSWFGKSFKNRNKILQVVGIRTSARKNVMVLRDEMTGKEFVGSVGLVRMGLG